MLLSLVNCVVCTRVPDSSTSTNFFPGCENFSRYVREFTSYTFARRRPVSFARSSVTAARRSSSVIRSAGRAGSTRALTSQTRTGDKGANPHAAHVSPWLLQEITGWVQPQAQQTGTPCATEMRCFTANQCYPAGARPRVASSAAGTNLQVGTAGREQRGASASQCAIVCGVVGT